MKPYGLYEGDRSEFLAQFGLSTIGFCVPVPRQFDHFGVDLFVHFLRKVGLNVVSTGRVITVQVKSTDDLILVDNDEKRNCLYQSSSPFFVAVADKVNSSLSIYTTLLKWITYWTDRNANVCLIPGPKTDELPGGADAHNIFLGEPIVQLNFNHLEHPETKVATRQMLFNVMERWAKWDQKHIAWRDASLPFVACPGGYHTNELFSTAYGDIDFMTFADRAVLPAVEADLAAYLTGARGYYNKLLEHAPAANPADDQVLHERMHLIDAVLESLVGPEA
jgi:hypothetical protein